MKNFGRLFQIGLLTASFAATTLFAAAQDTTATADASAPYPADQSTNYPPSQAPAPPAGQQMPSTSGQQVDPPGRVARLEYMTGAVSVQPQGTGDWVDGSLNRPLTIGDNVWADKDSRAELNLGTGLLRISSETSLTLSNVTNDAVQVQLHQGTLNVHVRKLYGGEVYEIDTPNQAFTVSKSGDYRFDVDPAGDATVVTVWKGEGEATGQGPAIRVHAGQQARFTNGNSLTSQIGVVPQPDGFDDWCQVRDKREDNSVSARYVAPGVVGADDLDEYGTWRQAPDYGPVWVPTAVAPGWAPYRYGHWAWVAPWGWTWVDDAPWGFAPFHYGRWVSFGGYWGWAPGPYYARPYYAPALVAWFGGPGFGIGFGFGFGGGFGWCPLGFGEPFFPWYGASRGYFRNVNVSNTHITNITNITNNYYNNRNGAALYGRNGVGMPRYASNPGALTAVSRNTLEHGLPVAANAARTSPSALRNLSSIGRPDASPTREGVVGPKAGVSAARPSAAVASRPTQSRMTPPATSARPSATQAPASRGPVAPTQSRAPQGQSTNARSMPAPAGRFVPRPPQSLGNSSPASSSTMSRNVPSATTQMAMNHNVPRPPQSGTRSLSGPATGATARTGSAPSSPLSRSASRPAQGSISRPSSMMSARNTVPNTYSAPRSYSTPYFGRNMPSSSAPRNYSSAQSGGNYSARSYGNSGFGGYGGYRGYSAPSSGGSYGGGRSYSAPSSHSSGSFGGSHGSGSYHGSSGGGSGSHGGHR
jgi:Family of unknown function (DUF6600)/FecR protein